MFRNARFYRYSGLWPESEALLSAELSKAAFTPCGPLIERSSGWIPLDGTDSGSLARRVNGADLIRLRSQSRVLPAAAVNEALEARIADYRARMQEEPGRREKRRLKAATRDELMAKALLKSDRIWGFVDPATNIIAIDSAQPAAAERFLRYLRIAFADLEIKPLKFTQPVEELLTRIFLGDAPPKIALGRECRMQDCTDVRSVVRWADFDLTDKTIRTHVADGMRLTHLGIQYDNVMSCVLDENGALSKVRFIGMDEDNAEQDKDPLGQQDTVFVLLTGTLRSLLNDLQKQLGGYE
jgi:recombination associated protein RdgC